ncbi:MAG TPA: hypothetical protein VGJ93_02020 [Desulfuromonadaceae bacterium]|jgi:hypothetical protein
MWGLGLGSIFLLAASASLSCCDSVNTPQGLAVNEIGSKIIGTTSNSTIFQTSNIKATVTHLSTDSSLRIANRESGDKTERTEQ